MQASPRVLLTAAALALLPGLCAAAPPTLAGCPVFPSDNVWNAPVDGLPVHPMSAQWVASIGVGGSFHADFGSGEYPPGSGSPIGIPWVSVPGSQTPVAVVFDVDDESDPGPYPIPPTAPIEGGSPGPENDSDRHVLVVDRGHCILYEMFYAFQQLDGSWEAYSGAVFDLSSNALRPATWTSADAAGLPILPGLVRYEEVAAGEIRHALRFTAPTTRRAFIWPARHQAGATDSANYPPMGARFRLKATTDLSGLSPDALVIAHAMQHYGLILADNGSPWFVSGAPSESWDNDVLHELDVLTGADFEAVDTSGWIVDPNSGATSLGLVFSDGFESGTTAAWSAKVP